MLRRVLLVAGSLAVLTAILAVASLAAPPKAPVVTSISPKRLAVGDTLTIRGRNFVPGKFKNVVLFQRPRSRAVFIAADRATRTRIKIRITNKLQPFLAQRGGQPVHTRFALRVLSRRLGKRFTSKRLSPLVGPPTGIVAPPAATPDCDHDKIPNSVELDDDNDLLSDVEEERFKMNTCNPDHDGDGMEDGWEYYSALDLNSRAVPYPGKRPFPNPMDRSDSGYDHDGDGLYQPQEYAAWVRYGNHRLLTPEETGLSRLLYSDGDQQSYNENALIASKPWLDSDLDGRLTDDERDVDGDGLRNHWESNGPGTLSWWKSFFKDEKPYTLPYPELDFLDPDSDGDTVLDGEDDQDHDDWSNLQELVGARADGAPLYGLRTRDLMVHPYNPCLPNHFSRTCSRYLPPQDEVWPPFDETYGANLPQSLPYGGSSEMGLHWPADW